MPVYDFSKRTGTGPNDEALPQAPVGDAPYDAKHPLLAPGDHWRAGDAAVSYGHFAGPGNIVDHTKLDYLQKQLKKNPAYNYCEDPRILNDPNLRPVDGVDLAACHHDVSYGAELKDKDGTGGPDSISMWSWEGIKNTSETDRKFVAELNAEMAKNGGKYTQLAQTFSKGARGFFGARAMADDAASWLGDRADEVGEGISNFCDNATGWQSTHDAWCGITQGAGQAEAWIDNTGRSAWDGVSRNGQALWNLGAPGMLAATGGFLTAGGAGGAYLAGQAWDGAKQAGGAMASNLSEILPWA